MCGGNGYIKQRKWNKITDLKVTDEKKEEKWGMLMFIEEEGKRTSSKTYIYKVTATSLQRGGHYLNRTESLRRPADDSSGQPFTRKLFRICLTSKRPVWSIDVNPVHSHTASAWELRTFSENWFGLPVVCWERICVKLTCNCILSWDLM